MTVSAMELAGELVRRSAAKGRPLTNLSVQKLAYFCHGWHLALTGEPLVGESFSAWKFGPVLPSVYHQLKVFSSNPIPPTHPWVANLGTAGRISDHASQIIDQVLDLYGQYSGPQLVNMSHVSNGPWAEAWSKGEDLMADEKIAQYFRSMLQH
ncbi:Panacea domain-containing protein [Pandoraea sputorum]|uniref:Panacea domain-containing protein n=1 Tax=Pandoraea sputorum TaxID=93222 RepID=UPI00123FA2FC|nr:type II toxin-antitoxin system antitoxin SocA domain-containing protein [Pandoraea sputorum]VVE33956.1 hypothetical protein PSP20601_03783 [Pandoraea sputorum]